MAGRKRRPVIRFLFHYQGWFDARCLPNLLLVHFNHLKADLLGQMRRIADFLEIEIEEPLWPKLIEHCSLDYMRTASSGSPLLQLGFKHGAADFFYRGTNGRWRDLLTADDMERYERIVQRRLSPDSRDGWRRAIWINRAVQLGFRSRPWSRWHRNPRAPLAVSKRPAADRVRTSE